MKLIKHSLALATAAATLATSQLAFAEDTVVELYTWRVQDEALFDYINERHLIPGVQVNLNVYTEDIESKLPVADLGLDMSAFGEAALAGATGSDGDIYGVPFVMQMESILYNTAVFDGAPTTLDELEAAFAELKDQGIVPMHVDGRDGWYLNQVLHETILAGMTSDDWAQNVVTGDACFTDDLYVDAMERFKSWQDAGYLNPNPLADDRLQPSGGCEQRPRSGRSRDDCQRLAGGSTLLPRCADQRGSGLPPAGIRRHARTAGRRNHPA